MKLTGNLVDIEITDHRDGFINVNPQITLDSLSEHEERDLVDFVKDIIAVCAKHPKLIDVDNLTVNYQPTIKYRGSMNNKEENDAK